MMFLMAILFFFSLLVKNQRCHSCVLHAQCTWLVTIWAILFSSSCMFLSAWSCEGSTCNTFCNASFGCIFHPSIVNSSMKEMFHANWNDKAKKNNIHSTVVGSATFVIFIYVCQVLTNIFKITMFAKSISPPPHTHT